MSMKIKMFNMIQKKIFLCVYCFLTFNLFLFLKKKQSNAYTFSNEFYIMKFYCSKIKKNKLLKMLYNKHALIESAKSKSTLFNKTHKTTSLKLLKKMKFGTLNSDETFRASTRY